MTGVISKTTAERIWRAHREIEAGETLLDDLVKRGNDDTPLDPNSLGRGIQLGYPTGPASHRLLQVRPALARRVIEAQIEAMKLELREACRQAAEEALGE